MLVKAFFYIKDKPQMIVPCMFNPKELTIDRSNKFDDKNPVGLSSPILQFGGGNARTVTMDLFFDTYEQGIDVRLFTDRITGWDAGIMFSKLPEAAKGLMDIDSDLHAPPICIFVWGAFIFQCVIEKVTKRFTMFLPEGIPVRATLNVILKECREVKEKVIETNKKSADLTKSWVVTQGDSLWAIAAKEYGSPEDWRQIAKKNNIENPRILNPGQRLVIPVKE
jgi:hypothetical protein